MKKLYKLLLVLIVVALGSCTYDFPADEAPTQGSADFTKVVVLGNSISSGFMDGALYDAGQNAAFANLLAIQMQSVSGGAFNQPNIGSVNGFFTTDQSNNPLGHLVLKNPLNPAPAPIGPGDFISDFSGDRSTLNNFAVPGARTIDASVAGYGQVNPYFGRFASSATASILGDAVAANGSFFVYWLGNNDVLGYALSGGTGEIDGTGANPSDMTPVSLFDVAFNGSIDAMMANGASGAVTTIPYVSDAAYFTTVPWNSIVFDADDPVDAATIEALNAGYAAYNGGLDAMVTAGNLSPEEALIRKIQFGDGANGMVIMDNDLTDLSGAGLPSMRLSATTDKINLPAAAVLGQDFGSGVVGLQVPLDDELSLTSVEQGNIYERVDAFNAIIKSKVSGSSGKLALVDANLFFEELVTNGASINGSGMDATLFPPYGGFSVDGLHPNQRCSGYIANQYLWAINATFGSNIPELNPNDLPGNALPVP